MDNIAMPAYSPTIIHAILAHKDEAGWYEKSLRRIVFSVISDNEQCFRPLNDTRVDASMDFVESMRKALSEYGAFPRYKIGNLWISFKVLHNVGRQTVRLRMYVYVPHFHIYRIVLPVPEAISAVLHLIDAYKKFEEEIENIKK